MHSFLSGSLIIQFSFFSEGWCLQFNQHLEKTLLVPVATEPKQVLQKTSPETGGRGTPSQGIAIAHIIFPDFFFKYLHPVMLFATLL